MAGLSDDVDRAYEPDGKDRHGNPDGQKRARKVMPAGQTLQ